MAVAKFWRLQVSATVGTASTLIWLSELKFFAASGAELTGTPIASSEYSGAYLKENAFDNSPTTEYSSVLTSVSPAPQWIGLEFATPCEVAYLTFRSANSSGGQHSPVASSELQTSSDGVSWTTDRTIGNPPAGAGQTTVIALDNSLVTTTSFSQYWASVGDPPPASPVIKSLGVRSSYYRHFVGNAVIEGVVTIQNVPASRPVFLFLKKSKTLVAETVSAANGQYKFENLDPDQEYFVWAEDSARNWNAVTQDMVRAS